MKKIFLLTVLLMASLSFNAQAGKPKKIKYKTLPSGLRYAIFHDEPGEKGQPGNAVFFYMEVYRAKSGQRDSLLSGNVGEQAILLQEVVKPGTVEELMLSLSPGDSAACLVNVKKFFDDSGYPEIPPFLKSTDDLLFLIKVTKFMTREAVEAIRQERESERNAMQIEQMKAYKEEMLSNDSIQAQLRRDDAILKDYLQKNKIEAQRSENGVYYVIRSAGNGRQNVAGEQVTVHYKGMLLNGETFDSSEGRTPFEFTLGVGQVIVGWDEALLLLKKGDKATIYIPAALGYGSQGSPPVIPPNSCLIFEVEVLE